MVQDKIDKAIHKCYVELFKNSTPPADFDLLVENATINEYGQKEINFMAHEIDSDKYDEIVSSVIKEFKMKGWYEKAFKATIALGCSPKHSKIN